VRIVLVCVGRLRGEPFADDEAHYRRLIERQIPLEIRELREMGVDPRRKAEALRKEAEAVLARLPSDAFVCALDRSGTALSSTELARFLEERRQSGRDLAFVVGGPYGLDASVTDRADAQLSFGPITLPHQLARVVLLEQLFRAHKILAGEPYHY
jgi:23S rRNA (pseudouridine1915-N3)-methyltransferase